MTSGSCTTGCWHPGSLGQAGEGTPQPCCRRLSNSRVTKVQLNHAATETTDLMHSVGSSSVGCQAQDGLQAAGCPAA